MKKLIFLFFACFSVKMYAQQVTDGDFNVWFLLNNRLSLNDRWSISNELHERNNDGFGEASQFLERPSLDYHLNGQVEFSLGYTFLRSTPVYPSTVHFYRNENNIWWQALLKSNVGKVLVQHRFRQENRWVDHVERSGETYDITGLDYNNRFRYRITVTAPIVHFANEDELFVNVFDEFWFTQDKHLRPMDFTRNWLFAGLGYRFNKDFNVQVGYMNQYDRLSQGAYVSTPIIQSVITKNFSLTKERS